MKYSIPHNFDIQQVISKIGEEFQIIQSPPEDEHQCYYDTFDWRLYNKSLVLYKNNGEIFLRELLCESPVAHEKVEKMPAFIWDIEGTKIYSYLSNIVEMRAFLPFVEVRTEKQNYSVLNKDKKTVLRFRTEQIFRTQDKKTSVLTSNFVLLPVRGYKKEFKNINAVIDEFRLPVMEQSDIFLIALDSTGTTPGDYSSKPKVDLNPQMPADEATKEILKSLFEIIKINEPYIEKDIDTEFLHDYRVAIRRSRSALSQIKEVFPLRTTERFKNELRIIQQATNQLRDLDVYLLKKENYKSKLPENLKKNIDPLYQLLHEKRKTALREVTAYISSDDYRKKIEDWEYFLNRKTRRTSTALNAAKTVIEVSNQRIFKIYRKIVKKGWKILQNISEEQLHQLRIDCKKLRYLLEFFSGLYPKEKISSIIKQLKKLQDNLGAINDYHVQQTYLESFADELSVKNKNSKKTILAIGNLIGVLETEKQETIQNFKKVFGEFASAKNETLFKELFQY